MATFLDLVRAVARESGTVSDLNSPATVAGQTGRLARFVYWVRDAYVAIQTSRDDWRWLRHDVVGTVIPGVGVYAPAAFGVGRFGGWVFRSDIWPSGITFYRNIDGPTQEGTIPFLPWEQFRREARPNASSPQSGPPAWVTVDPQDNLVLWPTPDVASTLRAEVIWSPQVLTVDADVPEMPAAHHDAIKYKALLLMATFDEAFDQEPRWAMEFERHMAALARRQTPRLELCGPLA